LVKNRDPAVFFSRLASFYQLVGHGRLDLDFEVKVIDDLENFVESFTARKYSALITGDGDEK